MSSKEYHKQYYLDNKDKIILYGKEYRKKHKKQHAERDKIRNTPERIEGRRKAEVIRNNNNPHKKWTTSSYNHHKTRKGFTMIITKGELYEMAVNTTHCYYCGCKLKWERENGIQLNSPSLDRTNNDIILTKNNCKIICHSCNFGKSKGTPEEYIDRCVNVARLHGKEDSNV